MADISILSRLINGIQRNVNLQSNTLVVGSLKVGSVSPTELTKAILDNLVTLQNGSDISASLHHHDGRYFTETELGSSGGSSGSDLIGDDDTYTNFNPTAATVKGALEGIDAALATAGSDVFADDVFRIQDDGDATKQIAFQASGIATATTRVITMPDADVDLADVNDAVLVDGSRAFTANQPMGGNKLTGLAAGSGAGDSVRYEQAILASGVNAFSANQSMGSNKLTNLANPTSAQDAVTKIYVDELIEGLKPKQAVRVGTIANVDLSSMPAAIDGVTLANGDRVLVKNQTNLEDNGIYIFNGSGNAATRSTDFDSLSPIDEINNSYTFIQEGTQAGQGWVQTGEVVTLGTDPINFVYFNSVAGLIGGDMVTVTGSTISVDLAATSGLESTNPGNSAGQLRVKLEATDPTLRITGLNELGVKLDSNGAIIATPGGLMVEVDGTTIERASNEIRIADDGVTAAKINSDVAGEGLTQAISGALDVNVGDGIEIVSDEVRAKVSDFAGSGLEDDGSNNLRIATSAAGAGLTGGGGSALSVQYAPQGRTTLVAGESFAADTTFLVRYAIDGETASRVYKADNDASTDDLFYAIGLVKPASAVSAGGNIDVISFGLATLGNGDTNFGSADVGKPVYLGSSGAFTLTAPTAADTAVFRVGVVADVDKIWVGTQQLNGIN